MPKMFKVNNNNTKATLLGLTKCFNYYFGTCAYLLR